MSQQNSRHAKHAGQSNRNQKLSRQHRQPQYLSSDYNQNFEYLRNQERENEREMIRKTKSSQKQFGFIQHVKGMFGFGKNLKCRVKDCKQNHQAHYCKECGNSDSNHFSSLCPYGSLKYKNYNYNGKDQKFFPTYNQNSYKKQAIMNMYPNKGGQVYNNKNNFIRRTNCQVKGCLQKHLQHYCKICKKMDSDHFSSECHYGRRDSRDNYYGKGKKSENYERGFKSSIFGSDIDDNKQYRDDYLFNQRTGAIFGKVDPNKDSQY